MERFGDIWGFYFAEGDLFVFWVEDLGKGRGFGRVCGMVFFFGLGLLGMAGGWLGIGIFIRREF